MTASSGAGQSDSKVPAERALHVALEEKNVGLPHLRCCQSVLDAATTTDPHGVENSTTLWDVTVGLHGFRIDSTSGEASR